MVCPQVLSLDNIWHVPFDPTAGAWVLSSGEGSRKQQGENVAKSPREPGDLRREICFCWTDVELDPSSIELMQKLITWHDGWDAVMNLWLAPEIFYIFFITWKFKPRVYKTDRLRVVMTWWLVFMQLKVLDITPQKEVLDIMFSLGFWA